MRLVSRILICAALASGPAFAQVPEKPTVTRKHAAAARVPNGAIRVDGRLDEPAWRTVTPVTDFVQKDPVEGAAPTDPMEVRIAYDDDVLYVGARMVKIGRAHV